MTHSLHRSGDIESLKNDFVWFMYQAKGINNKNFKPKALECIEVVEKLGSENWGDVKSGPTSKISPEEIKQHLSDKSRIRGVFTQKEQVVEFLKEMKKKDLGQSVVISGLLSEVIPACKEANVNIHSVNFSLGVFGKKELLPEEDVLSITTMCGHHIISPKYVKYLIGEVEKNNLSPEEATKLLSNFCYCGIFNPVRCKKILEEKQELAREF